MERSTFLHLRILFSFFLLPVFLFALAISENVVWWKTFLVFFIVHFLLYPASNSFNSYFDKDEKSIGLLKNPPPVLPELYYVSIVLDAFALLLGLLIDWKFSLMLLIFSLVSRAYSHPSIRLKKYPVTGWFIAGFFQGCFTFLMIYYGINSTSITALFRQEVYWPALLSSFLLWGSYPMTQVYQHEEDGQRGDMTLSLKLGVIGTFIFTCIVFSLADFGFLWFFYTFYTWQYALLFQLFLLPVLFYFFIWFHKVIKDKQMADYKHTMSLNWISATAMNLFFLIVFLTVRMSG